MEIGTKIPGDGARWRLYLTLHCHDQNDPCIKMGSNESHFNVSVTGQDKVTITRQSPQTTAFEEKGELKQNQNEVLLLTREMID